jgi:phosphohistidine phosphatase
MIIYLMRHGPAVQLEENSELPDAKRPLTPDGRKKTRLAARGLRRLGVEVDVVLTSPLVRAKETADLVMGELSLPPGELRETTNLAPGADHDSLLRELSQLGHASSFLLVGHEPDLSHLASRLLVNGRTAVDIMFKKAAVCCVAVTALPPKSPGQLLFMLQPKQLRSLAD